MRITPELTGLQICILGKFNPEILTLEHFVEGDLFGKTESEAADERISNKWVTDFSVEWCRVLCTTERFLVSTQQAPWIRLADLCLRLFGEIHPDTRIGYMGINRTVQFDAGSVSARDTLGRDLAPREIWGEWGKILESDTGQGQSGLSLITLKQGHGLNDRLKGYIEARLQPGPNSMSSVLMHVNDHYEAVDGDERASGGELLRVLANNFEQSVKRSDWIVDQIMQRVKK